MATVTAAQPLIHNLEEGCHCARFLKQRTFSNAFSATTLLNSAISLTATAVGIAKGHEHIGAGVGISFGVAAFGMGTYNLVHSCMQKINWQDYSHHDDLNQSHRCTTDFAICSSWLAVVTSIVSLTLAATNH